MHYVDIRTVESGRNVFGIADPAKPARYQVWGCRDGTNTPVVRTGEDSLDLDRRLVGLRVTKKYRPPSGPPAEFTREEAVHVAHQVGRYYFKLGDLVWTYTTVDGLRDSDFFERRE